MLFINRSRDNRGGQIYERQIYSEFEDVYSFSSIGRILLGNSESSVVYSLKVNLYEHTGEEYLIKALSKHGHIYPLMEVVD